MAHDNTSTDSFILPANIVGPTDLGRLIREAENLDNFLQAAAIRQGGEAMKLPKTSHNFDELVAASKLNMLNETDRQNLIKWLSDLKKSAPTIHISFSSDPPAPILKRLVEWLRREIHPELLVRVGMQPNIGAGCIVRTNNRMFDFSLKQFFATKGDLFIEKLNKVEAKTAEVAQ